MAATNVRLITKAPWLPPVMSKRNGLCGERGATEKKPARTGQPVTTAFAPQDPAEASKPAAMRFEIFASTRFVKPGSALGSKITLGTPRIQVASIIGPAA